MKLKPPMRFWIAVMIFVTTAVNYCFRTHFQISLIAMLDKSGRGSSNEGDNSTTSAPDYGRRFKWNTDGEQFLIAGYFYGYTVGSPFGGPAAELLGPWNIIFWTTILSAVCSSISVPLAMDAWWPLFICRFFIGLLGAFHWPSLQCLIGRWAPPNEKGKFSACLMGNTFGTVLTQSISGFIISGFGWVWSFYFTVIITVVFCIFWFLLVADYPDQQWFTKEEEVAYINESQQGSVSKEKVAPPLLAMFTSVPFIVLVIFQYGNLFILYLIILQIPKFLNDVLNFNIKAVGGLSALPPFARLIAGFIFGSLVDFLLSREIVSKKVIRKGFAVISHIAPGVTFFLYMLIESNKIAAVSVLVLLMCFNGAAVVTSIVNAQDLAPNFAGTQYGIMNFFGSTTGFIIPAMVGAITKDQSTMAEWRIIFGISGVVTIACGILFIIFGSTDLQPWNEKKSKEGQETS